MNNKVTKQPRKQAGAAGTIRSFVSSLLNLFCHQALGIRSQAAASMRTSRLIAAAFLLISAFCVLRSALAANVHFHYTFQIGGGPDTNTFRIQGCSSNILADGSVQVSGIPTRLRPDTNGETIATNLAIGWYADIDHKVVFQVWDSSSTLYDVTNLVQSGFSTYVVRVLGTNPPPTFNQITNGLGGLPLFTTNASGLTNGFIDASVATNVANTKAQAVTNGFIAKVDGTNIFNGLIVGGTNGFIRLLDATNVANAKAQAVTNGFIAKVDSTNIFNGLIVGGTNGFVRASITNGFIAKVDATNIAAAQAQSQTNGFIAKVDSTNIFNGLIVGGTNGFIRLLEATNVANARAQAVTNGFIAKVDATNIAIAQAQSQTNGFIAKVDSTNIFNGLIPGGTNGFIRLLDATNVANAKAQAVTNGFIAKVDSTNIFNGLIVGGTNGFIRLLDATNVANVRAQSVTNGFIRLLEATNVAQSFSSGKANTNAPTIFAPTFVGPTTNTGDLHVSGTAILGQINSDGGLIVSDGDGTLNVEGTVSSLLFVGNGENITNIPVSAHNTNGSTANQVPASIGGSVVWTTATTVLGFDLSTVTNVANAKSQAVTNGFIAKVDGTNIFNGLIVGGTNGFIRLLDATNVANAKAQAVTNGFIAKVDGTNIFNGLIVGGTNGLIAKVDSTNIFNGLIVGGTNGLIAKVDSTNIFNGLIVGGTNGFIRLLDATNEAIPRTNGFSTGQSATNFSVQGSFAWGVAGNATNFLAATNVIKFYNAGSSLVTNGTWYWSTTAGGYTNPTVYGVFAYNGSAWLMQTNGVAVTLYSITNATPIGQWTRISGDTPAPTSVFNGALDLNGLPLWGQVSATNLVNTPTNAPINNYIIEYAGGGRHRYIPNAADAATSTNISTSVTLPFLQQMAAYLMAPGVPFKKAFYVAPTGYDTNSGLSPASPLATLSFASHVLATNYGDLLWVLPGTNINEITQVGSYSNVLLANGVSVYFTNGAYYFMSNRYSGATKANFRPISNSRIRFSAMTNGLPTAGLMFRPSSYDGNTFFGYGGADANALIDFTNSFVDDGYFDSWAGGPHWEVTSSSGKAGIIFNNPTIIAHSLGMEFQGWTNGAFLINGGQIIVATNGTAGASGSKPRRAVESGLTSGCNVSFLGTRISYDQTDGRESCGVYVDLSTSNSTFFAGCTFTNVGGVVTNDIIVAAAARPASNHLWFDSATRKSDATAFTETNTTGNTVIMYGSNQPPVVYP